MSRTIWIPLLCVGAQLISAQPPLRTVAVPRPVGQEKYVRSLDALAVLGKALFWDMQVGSDARTACASCHFHAGADHRNRHQLVNAFHEFPLNVQLSADDFPFRLLADRTLNTSTVLRENSGIYGSAGVFRRKFSAVNALLGDDDGYDLADTAPFVLHGLGLRQITTRNTPSVINAVFNARNFWDGRARNLFNGLNPFGASDPGAHAWVERNGTKEREVVALTNASLASQAVGPPGNAVEMAYDGANWQSIAQRLLPLQPLARQHVAADDSLLGALANPLGTGLLPGITYRQLIRNAFQEAYSQLDENFPLFFGLALAEYQARLVSDDSRFDRFAAGDNTALSAQEVVGLNLFRGRAGCNTCHAGPQFTLAAIGAGPANGRGPGANAGPDTGFFRIGVSPVEADPGLGALDDFGLPLARALNANNVQGAFKVPGLRNVELTGPYLHNGGQATLEQVVEFYNRGGDYPAGGVGPSIRRLNLSADERASLVAFLKALTDDRVKFERAPFDHPELCVPNGHTDTVQTDDARFTLSAGEHWVHIAAVGRAGARVPLQSFKELLEGIGSDGSRANALQFSCPAAVVR